MYISQTNIILTKVLLTTQSIHLAHAQTGYFVKYYAVKDLGKYRDSYAPSFNSAQDQTGVCHLFALFRHFRPCELQRYSNLVEWL